MLTELMPTLKCVRVQVKHPLSFIGQQWGSTRPPWRVGGLNIHIQEARGGIIYYSSFIGGKTYWKEQN